MAHKWAPKAVYSGGTLIFTLPSRWWNPSSGAAEGGMDISAAGIGETFVVRWQEDVEVAVRFTDAEYAAVQAWWQTVARSQETFTWYFDQATGPNFSVILDKPTILDRFKPTRLAGSPWVWEVTVTMRRSTTSTTPVTASI